MTPFAISVFNPLIVIGNIVLDLDLLQSRFSYLNLHQNLINM